MKEKLIIEYLKNYLEYFEKNTEEETSILFFMLKLRIKEVEKLNKEQLKILNENMKSQVEV